MPRSLQKPLHVAPLSPGQIERLVADAVDPRHFFACSSLDLVWELLPSEEVTWEVFRGRLLEPAQTRQRRTFASWNIYLIDGNDRSTEPLLSVKWDKPGNLLHVVRAIRCNAWEAYDAGDNTILSRQTIRWIRELVGSLPLAEFPTSDDLRAELTGWLFRAIVGTSRLPLTSVEAPLPGFALGKLGYFHRSTIAPPGAVADSREVGMRSWRDLITLGLTSQLTWLEQTKLLELMLRAVADSDMDSVAELFVQCWQRAGQGVVEIPLLLRNLFQEVSLSPYTDFVERTLAFVQALVASGHIAFVDQVDFLSFLLRQVGRHLTAYDLITFHHRGANYPDALLLDAVLKNYLQCIEQQPSVFLAQQGEDEALSARKRIRRRALRQGCLLRHFYQDHPVPDAPTSPGENARVLPPPHVSVPEEQLLNPARWTRRLYAGDPLPGLLGPEAQGVFRASLADLHHAAELRELGTAIFIDRPLGRGKQVGEPDHTPLFAHEAFSASMAERRLRMVLDLAALLPRVGDIESPWDDWRRRLHELSKEGLPVQAVLAPGRAIVSLADAIRVADDFVVRRTLASSINVFVALFDFGPLAQQVPLDFLLREGRAIIARVPSIHSNDGVLAIYDDQTRKRLELEVNVEEGFVVRAGVEYPLAGLRVLVSSLPSPQREQGPPLLALRAQIRQQAVN